ncbi:nucleoside triphosphate pyrophosphohydrolase [Ornithinibacillus halophilus]|uniref:Predicted house-cleaning noncanonical NTP pyrophosphatase, all-alpha NTP-PPase (MazG) superfamily n=1 Tax=Ornithinibacillus halophilus TaxID=930117 RepID=A0A1M5KTL6_9BACI|nr:nucleoside triphosphate pyrophosphohydrolase [Ornithinibacillus halophilus]SHG56202.1 Predicted house-cleaning noncanonical NTP pyrophosphatase, all-alpha NTP-PPase (MazG) superfamily [Ornithinibacillus halophilus]
MPTYNKLVRDKIPEIIKNTGKGLKTEILPNDRYIEELKIKLNEEVSEYQEAKTDIDALEELADILELMHSLAKVHGESIQKVEQIREEKAAKRGGFEEKIYLVEVDD